MTLGVLTKKYLKRPQASHRSRFDERSELGLICNNKNSDHKVLSVITSAAAFGLGCRAVLRLDEFMLATYIENGMLRLKEEQSTDEEPRTASSVLRGGDQRLIYEVNFSTSTELNLERIYNSVLTLLEVPHAQPYAGLI